MGNKRIVMKDIAKAAGLHQTTVSLALADNPRIAKKTREKIQALAREMGYVPDPNLVSLVSYRKDSKHTNVKPSVAIIFDLDDDYLFNEADYLPTIQKTAEKKLEELGYSPQTLFLGRDFSSTESLNRLLYNRGIEGVIFAATYHTDTHYELDWKNYSMVKIHEHPFELKIDSIMPNHIDSMRVAMERLKAHGYKRPVFVAHRLDELHTQNAFSLAFYYSQSIFDPQDRIEPLLFTRKSEEELVQEVADYMIQNDADAVLSVWNNMNLAAERAGKAMNKNCYFLSLHVNKTKYVQSGVVNDYEKITKVAVDNIIAKMRAFQKGLPDPPCITLVESEWVENNDIQNLLSK